MKKIYLFALLISCVFLQAQNPKHTERYYNSWRLGLNAGAMWQTADVRSIGDFAGGFTLEKGFFENKTHFFSLAIKGRGLWGNTYGLDYKRNYDITGNPALVGKINPLVKYDSLAAIGSSPYVYNNYKTKIAEGALELQICFNKLREQTNILLNLWGGIGFTSYRTRVDLLDGNNKMYNYRLVDSTGGKAQILSSHHFLLDDKYESFGTNSQNGNVLTLSPSCGIGIGYRFNDHISLLWEYKLTFPQGIYADYLDGIDIHNNNWLGCNKDYYHYTCLNLLIRLGRGHHKTSTSSNVNNYTPVHTNTVVTNPTTSVTTNPTTTVVTQTVIAKPAVTITNPPTTPYTETVVKNFTVVAKVYNVNNRSEVNVTFNGTEIKNYSWFGKTISFVAPLSVGNNIISVTAANAAGSDSKSALIIYSGVPPQITITTPGANKVTSTQNTADIYATILNVESANNISVKYNGQPFTSFTYNATNKLFGMNVNLANGTNTVDINATNSFGNDFESQLIIYNPTTVLSTTVVGVKPVSVVITDPSVNPYKSLNANYNVKANVTGVTSQNQVTVTANGVAIGFNYLNGSVNFDIVLGNGSSLIQVSARNGKSADSKSTVINYEMPKKILQPPTVVIINPQPSPQTTSQTNYEFKANTTFIGDKNQLEVKYNGVVVTNYSFDAVLGIIDFNANLVLNSNNIFEVKATNPTGSANANGIVKQEQPKTKVICHRVDRATMQTITIFENEWLQHQAHGDYEGACEIEDKKITICHIPPGNNQNPQTIEINESAWPAHQAHGDVMGACPKVSNSETVDPDITICHKNTDASNQTIIVKQSQWAQHQAHGDVMGACPKVSNEQPLDPDMIICHKNGDGTETKITIKQSQWATHQAHGDYVGGNCAVATSTTAPTTLEICHNNGDGTKTTMIIPSNQLSAHRGHGDVMGKCPQTPTVVTEDKKITICHIPPGNNQNPQTIEINESAWPAHEAHGDTKGACSTSNNNKITICHIPPGNNQNPQTIEINESAWPAHEAHGDTKGACPVQKTENPGKGKGEIKEEGNNGNKVPGRTNQSQTQQGTQKTDEPQKSQETIKLKPR